MKVNYAATFALTAWYLLSPPVMRVPRRGNIVNPTASLSYWKVRGSYESAADCENAKGATITLAADNPTKIPADFKDLEPDVMSEVTERSVCVAADDPRLHSDNFEMN